MHRPAPQNNPTNHPLAKPSWFQGAPTCKLLAISTAVAFLVLRSSSSNSISNSNSNKLVYNELAMDTIRLWQQPRRFWTSKLLLDPTAPGEFLTGTLLFLHQSRNLERQMGSRKFVSWLSAILLWNIALEFAFYYASPLRSDIGKSNTSTTSAALWHYNGPFPFLGALFFYFHWYTPRLHPRFVQAFGLSFSEKTLGYLWYALVLGTHGGHSVAAGLIGLVACVLYQHVPLPVFSESWSTTTTTTTRTILLPSRVVQWVSSWSSRLLEAPPAVVGILVAPSTTAAAPTARAHPGGAATVAQGQAVAAAAAAAAAAPRPRQRPFVPDPSAVQQLLSMGFDPEQVEQALQQTNNNVERAADRLLSAM